MLDFQLSNVIAQGMDGYMESVSVNVFSKSKMSTDFENLPIVLLTQSS